MQVPGEREPADILRVQDVGQGVDGEESNKLLVGEFLKILRALQPSLILDVGAHNGSASMLMRDCLPSAKVVAIEANPKLFALFGPALAQADITYLNLAVGDYAGFRTLYSPLKRTIHYEADGVVHSAVILEPIDTGKSSLLVRSEEAEYELFTVWCDRLDNVVLLHSDVDTRQKTALWIDAEGAAGPVLRGATELLRTTLAIFLELETYPFWRIGESASSIVGFLRDASFVPLFRDHEDGDLQFNTIFVRADLASSLSNNR